MKGERIYMKTDIFVQRLVDGYGSWVSSQEGKEHGIGRMSQNLYPYDCLFSPIKINRLTVKNRIMMAPMGNIDMCEETGRPNEKMLQYFFARAKGGTGLLATGLIPISHGIDNSITEKGKLSYFPRIDRSRTVMSGWRDLAQGVHSYGSRIFIQLTPGLGRVGNPQCLVDQFKFPGSASFNPNFYIPEVPCLRFSDHSLRKIIKNAGQAAADAKACGLDGVYLHGHEGYLLDQVTNPAFNRRKLGRYAKWQRFGIELIEEIRNRVGKDYPIMYRIDLSLALEETYGEEMKSIKSLKKFTGGRNCAQTLDYMKNLVKAGVDIFDVDLGCYDNWWLPHPPAGMPAGCFLEVSKMVKDDFEKNNVLSNACIKVPVVAVGKLGYPDVAEKALRDGMCDMIMLGRPLLADPEWPNKAYAGKVSEIRPCIGCQEGCINEFVDGGHPQCAVNARTGFEDSIPEIAAPAEKVKKIAVIGAGPGGINLALTASKRGHLVDLYEAGEKVGGKMIAGSVPANKYDFDNYRIYLEEQLNKAVENKQVTFIGEKASVQMLKDKKYDTIVTAIGTKGMDLRLPGIEEIPTVQATDLLVNPKLLGNAKDIVIIGGGVVGCETGYWLSYEKNCTVTIVEMLPHFMDGACTANRGHLIHYMKCNGVRLINMAKVESFSKGKVNIKKNVHKNIADPYNTWQPILPKNIPNPLAPKVGEEYENESLKADLVVFAMGGKPDDSLFFELQKQRVAPEIYNIGDSFCGGRVLEAMRSAYRLAVKL